MLTQKTMAGMQQPAAHRQHTSSKHHAAVHTRSRRQALLTSIGLSLLNPTCPISLAQVELQLSPPPTNSLAWRTTTEGELRSPGSSLLKPGLLLHPRWEGVGGGRGSRRWGRRRCSATPVN
jgi:hypothetical protein